MRNPTLLIGDDDRCLRETLGEVFRPRGFRTYLAADGEEALSILESRQIHVAVLDLHMPKVSGLEAIRVVRQKQLYLPCILISAQFDELVVTQARLLQLVRFLPKPFTLEEVINTVLRTFEESYGEIRPDPSSNSPFDLPPTRSEN